MKLARLFLFYLLSLLMLTGCLARHGKTVSSEEHAPVNTDNSCSYFYFLWGSHSEYNQLFEEALEAYQKALICDPSVIHIRKKIPVLLYRVGQTEKAIKVLVENIDNSPDDLSQHLLLAHLYIQQNQRDRAIAIYEQLLQSGQDKTNIQLRLGILYVQQDYPHKAEKTFQELLKNTPDHFYGHLYLARLYSRLEQFDKAAIHYENVLELNWAPEIAAEVITFYDNQGLFLESLRLYNRVLEINPEDEHAVLGKIQTLLKLKQDDVALEALKEYRASKQFSPSLDLAIAKVLLRLNNILEAQRILESLQESEYRSEVHYLLGLISFQTGDSVAAIDHLDAVSSKNSDYVNAVYLQVRIFRELSQTIKAIKLLERAITDASSSDPTFYLLLASLYQEQDQTNNALKYLTLGSEAFPDNIDLHFERALQFERSDLHDNALEAMHDVLQLDPDHSEALNYIGYTWAEKNIHLDKALKYIQRAIKIKPQNGFIRDSLGWVYFRLGRLHDAIQELQHALKLEPNDPLIFIHLGDVYRALNQKGNARKAYQQGLEMFEDEADKEPVRTKLNELDKI